MNAVFRADYYRMTGKKWGIRSWLDLITRYDLRYLLHIRSRRNVLFTLKSLRASRKYGLEILSSDIGEGLYIGHAHNINVHPQAVIGKNCNMNKGCTVGRENRGKRNGAPTIGNEVLIAPNAYVNFDVPSHSVVVGNPGKIISRENATKGYITYKV